MNQTQPYNDTASGSQYYDFRRGTGECAVLFVHGIMGSPRQFDFLLPDIPEEVSYFRLVLDGHGATLREFSAASMARWKEQVRRAVADLRAEGYRKIIAVTHSMGGLLTLDAARSVKIDSMVLLNMPLSLHPTLKFFAVPLAVSFNYAPKSDETFKAAMTCAGVHPGGNIFHYIRSINRFVELLTTMASTRRLLSECTCPVVAFYALRDEIVAVRSAKILARRPSTNITLLPTSGHFYYSPTDAATIASALSAILQGNVKNA